MTAEKRTQIKVVHAVSHEHIMKQSQSWVVVAGEEGIVSVCPADVSLCHRGTKAV